jgi:pyridinium-3,5-biscarboxylic acid mononucleotide synthase
VNHHADEHLEVLDALLSQQPFKHSSSQQKLQNSETSQISAAAEIRPDPHREQRKGVPEIIYGETKDIDQIVSMARTLLNEAGRTIISRVPNGAIEVLRDEFSLCHVRVYEAARAVVISKPDYILRRTGGQVGVISAGTSDVPVAQEAALIAEEMGCEVTCIYDVGVAGLHRLLEPLRDLLSKEVDAIIVAAGMDGALPSVVAGLVPVPVIGLPTSIGYGMGGKGVAALLSMLQTCAPGLSVVNIDNGVGAGITAAMIANRVASARSHQSL